MPEQDIAEIARRFVPDALRSLVEIMRDGGTASRKAARLLAERPTLVRQHLGGDAEAVLAEAASLLKR